MVSCLFPSPFHFAYVPCIQVHLTPTLPAPGIDEVPAMVGDSECIGDKPTTNMAKAYVAGAHETAGMSFPEYSSEAGETQPLTSFLQPGLRRVLNARHTYMISLASGIGTGLFVRILKPSIFLSLVLIGVAPH